MIDRCRQSWIEFWQTTSPVPREAVLLLADEVSHMDVEEVARAEPADSDVDVVPLRLGRKNHAQCLPERGPPDPRPASAARYRAGGIAQPLERLPAWPRGAMAGQTAESPEVLRIGVGDFLLEGVVRRACGGSATTIR